MKFQYQANQKLWMLPILFSALLACQEDNTTGPQEMPNTPEGTTTPAEPMNSPATMPESTSPPVSRTIPRNLEGEVVAIDGQNFTIKDSKGEEVKIQGTSMTLIDESIQVGDQAEVRFSEENQPTAIRKVRGT
jgi:hypothetical protein